MRKKETKKENCASKIMVKFKGEKKEHQENMPVYSIPPQTPLLYRKLGYAGVYIFFLFLLQNIDCGYSTIYVLSKNKKNIRIFQLKIFYF